MNTFLNLLAQVNLAPLPHVSADADRVQVILNIVFSIAGAICLLVITIAGFRYVISHGDPNLIAQSKNAIIYAVIGLIISLTAVTLVNFVVNWVG